MPSAEHFVRRVGLLNIAAAAPTLAGCGSGGDGDSSDSSGTSGPTAPTTGKVAILLTDGATDEFCQILATVESIELLSESGSRTNVFTGPETVDILAMRNYTDFFAIDPEVPIGAYEKVRMTLSDLALVRCDEQGVQAEADWAPESARQRQARPEPARYVRGDRRDDGHRARPWTWRSRRTGTDGHGIEKFRRSSL
jgi:hypothetical protein